MGRVLTLWLSDEEEKKIKEFRKKAQKEKRTVSNYLKLKLFGTK